MEKRRGETDTDPELARLATEYLDAVRADDTVTMARLVEEARERRRVLPPLADADADADNSAYRVDLYEREDGALTIVRPGGLAYAVTAPGQGEFEGAAVAILNGDAADWTPAPAPAAWLDLTHPSLRLIAQYDELIGAVTVERDPTSGQVLAGVNGRRYLGQEWVARLEAGDGHG